MCNVNIVSVNEYILSRIRQLAVVMERHLVVLLLALGAVIAQKDPHAAPGRSVIVHLFEWRFQDIARECEDFLAPYGYAGVQTSPVNENLVITTPNRPWYERYQPISYQLTTRSGTESEFRDMVRRCNNVGVRIYVDAVINHMSADANNAVGTGGNTADPQHLSYPAVPYGPEDFHPPCDINNYNNKSNVRDCELVGLHDLDQSKSHVREKLVEFMDTLVDAGIAGFRVDAAKHMWPEDLRYIYSQVKNLNTEHGFQPGSRPFYFQEVIDYGGEAIKENDYTGFGRVTEFKFGRELSNAMSGNNAIKWLRNFGVEWGFAPSEDVVVFVDNHDTQRGDGVLTYKQSKLYKMAVAFMLAWPYGYPRVMSSFAFDNIQEGPPHDSNNNILPVTVNADHTCNNGWVCEHRWRQIYNMVAFRNIVHGTSVTDWWDNGDKQIAFCRGNKGFIAINDQYNTDLKHTLQVCLPSGTYCDIISGNKSGNSCTGKSVTVNTDGNAYIEILANEEDGVLAIHSESKL